MPAVAERVLTWPLQDRPALVADVAAAAERLLAEQDGFASEAAWVLRLAELHPADPGVVAALLLNLLRLAPGEALYLPSGNLHAYLVGFGVEVMANSDNVLRGGLTPKHVDVPELQRVLDHTAGPIAVVSPGPVSAHEAVYSTAAPNFQLSRIDVPAGADVAVNGQGPQVLLCVRGTLAARHPDATVPLGQGDSVFVPAAAGGVELRGEGVAFRAAVPGHAVSA